jgi:hypothetical protein
MIALKAYATHMFVAISLLSAAIPSPAQEVASASQPAAQSVATAEPVNNPDLIEANPSRPSNSHSADLLTPGLLQAEYGFFREWERDSTLQDALGGELRFGISRNLEFRWGGNLLLCDQFPASQSCSLGDQIFTGEYHLRNQSAHFPAIAASYAIKVPTANDVRGLGTGAVDHSFTLLASKQVQKFVVDLNLSYQLIGQPAAGGHDQNAVVFLTVSHSLYGPLTFVAELDGYSRLNAQMPAYASTVWALSWKVHRRVALDAGVLPGITSAAPHKRVSFGVTYAIANLYPGHRVSGKG